MTDWNRCGRKAGEFGALSSLGAACGGGLCSQWPDAINVAAHSWFAPELGCSQLCSCGAPDSAIPNRNKKMQPSAKTRLQPVFPRKRSMCPQFAPDEQIFKSNFGCLPDAGRI